MANKKFTVTVEGKVYDVTAPDERTAWAWANATHRQAQAPKPSVPQAQQQGPQPETTLSGLGSEIGKGLLRGPSNLGMMIGTEMQKAFLGPIAGPMAARGIEALGAPSRSLIQPPPTTPAEKFAGTTAELGAAGIAGGAAGTIPGAINTGLMALGGATGEQLGEEGGKFAGTLTPLALSLLSRPVTAASRFARNLLSSKRLAASGLDEALGSRRAAVVKELKAPQVIVPGSQPTAPEAAVRAGRPEFAGLQKLGAQKIDPSGYRDIEKAQEAARLPQIISFGKDPAAIEAAEAARNAATAPGRQIALENANIAGRYLPEL